MVNAFFVLSSLVLVSFFVGVGCRWEMNHVVLEDISNGVSFSFFLRKISIEELIQYLTSYIFGLLVVGLFWKIIENLERQRGIGFRWL